MLNYFNILYGCEFAERFVNSELFFEERRQTAAGLDWGKINQ
jgi:hypothetical protein